MPSKGWPIMSPLYVCCTKRLPSTQVLSLVPFDTIGSPSGVIRQVEAASNLPTVGSSTFWPSPGVMCACHFTKFDPRDAAYALTGIHHDRLKVTAPFDIEIDLTAIGQRR